MASGAPPSHRQSRPGVPESNPPALRRRHTGQLSVSVPPAARGAPLGGRAWPRAQDAGDGWQKAGLRVGIFSKKPKIPEAIHCDVCDAVYVPGENPPHLYSHIAEISLNEPAWLPRNLRVAAQGEFTFRCDKCNSFPSIKWPASGGAFAGMTLHLAAVHHSGMLGTPGAVHRGSVGFDMIRIERAAAPRPSAWVPTVEMGSARPAVFALAMAPTLDDMQVRSAIAEFVRLSERPPLAQAQRLIHSEPDVMARPWAWLAAVMRRARDSGTRAGSHSGSAQSGNPGTGYGISEGLA